MRTVTQADFEKKYGSATQAFNQPEEKKSFTSRVVEDIKKRGENVANQAERNQGIGSDILQLAGQTAGAVTDIASEAVRSVGDVTGATENIVKPVSAFILDSELGKMGLQAIKGGLESYSRFKQENPVVANNLEAVLNISALLPVGKIAETTGKTALGIAEKGVETIGKTATKAGEIIAPAIQTTKNIATGVKDVAQMTAEGASRIPARIVTNVAEKKAVQESINQLPTQIAKKAVLDGVDLPDVKYLYQIPAEQKAPLRTLLKATQDFEKGATKTNPIEIVGKPIVNRIKLLESERSAVGQKLGTVADKIGVVTAPELITPVFTELKKINGLNGLKLGKGNVLDFSDTVLASGLSTAERKSIQKIFTEAVKWGDGKRKHLLRQELFEILGGKKRALTNITDTQERAYEAIRKGLANVLDTKNPEYKTLNQQYAKISQPLQDIRKFMKNTAGASEDILDMSAGLLARRLTSFSSTNPQIRNILKAMDNVTKLKGKTQLSIENLQDFYNILDRYYNIAGKTGFQGQVTAGLEKVTGVKDFITQAVGSVAGKTDAVKRKAIEDALREALK